MTQCQQLLLRLFDLQQQSTDECVPWWGTVDKYGFGRARRNNKTIYVHRLAFEVVNGEIPAGKRVWHICRNRSCINPRHFATGTHAEMLRAVRKPIPKRPPTPECIHGHPRATYTDININGKPFCRACARIAGGRQRAKKKSSMNGDCHNEWKNNGTKEDL